MANVLGNLFSDIADAIRAKTGGTDTMKPAEFPEQILSISGNSGSSESDEWVCESGTFTPTKNIETITHKLGKIPDIFYVKMNISFDRPTGSNNTLICMFGMSNNLLNNIENVGSETIYKVVSFMYNPSTNLFGTSVYSNGFDTFSSDYPVYIPNNMSINFGSSLVNLSTGYSYSWGVFAKK